MSGKSFFQSLIDKLSCWTGFVYSPEISIRPKLSGPRWWTTHPVNVYALFWREAQKWTLEAIWLSSLFWYFYFLQANGSRYLEYWGWWEAIWLANITTKQKRISIILTITLMRYDECRGESFTFSKRLSFEILAFAASNFTEVIKKKNLSWVEWNGKYADCQIFRFQLVEGFITRRKVSKSSTQAFGLSNVTLLVFCCFKTSVCTRCLLLQLLIYRNYQRNSLSWVEYNRKKADGHSYHRPYNST